MASDLLEWCHKVAPAAWQPRGLGDPYTGGIAVAKYGPKPRPLEERFWPKVDRRGPDECWPWLAALTDGYGVFGLESGNGNTYAHRFAYELLVGPIPAGLTLDHLCHNAAPACPGGATCRHRRCCNPAHLEPATMRENILRGQGISARAARATHCPKGHPYDEANTYRKRGGGRECRACHRAQVAEAARQKRAQTATKQGA